MDPAIALLAFVTLQRFVEFIWDWRNTQRLRASGAVEFGGLHYPAMMLVHAGWLAGLWVLGYDSPVIPGFVIAFLLLQVARYWVLATLGRRWTTRVMVMPGAPLIESGPYRLMRHPNYAIVAVELGAGAVGPRASPLRTGVGHPLRRYRAAARPGRELSLGGSAGGAPKRRGPDHALDRLAETRKRPHRAGAFIRVCRRAVRLAVCAVPRDPRNVRSGDANIGQFAVSELVQLVEARIVAPPGLEEVEDCDQHDLCLSIPGRRRVILVGAKIGFHAASQQSSCCDAAMSKMQCSSHCFFTKIKRFQPQPVR